MLILLILILNLLFASSFIIGKAVLQFSSPLFFVGFRMVFAGILLLLFNYFFSKKKVHFDKPSLILFGKLSLFHIYLPYVLEYWALQYVSAAKTSLLFNLSPFATAILAYLVFGEKLSHQKLIGLFIGFMGFIPILMEKSLSEVVAGEILYISLPELCIILSVICAMYAWILIQKHSAQNVSFSLLNGVSMFGGGLLALATSFISEQWSPLPVTDWSNFIYLTLLIVLVANIICYNLYSYLLGKFTATFLSFTGFTIAIFTGLLQFIFFKVPVTPAFYISGVIILVGLSIFYQEELKKGIVRQSH